MYTGYSYNEHTQQYKLSLQFKGESEGYGGTKSEEIAKKVASFARAHQDDDDVIEKSKKLLIELKSEQGERTKFWRGHWELEDNIKATLSEYKPKSLNDWKEKHGSSYNGARKIGKYKILFNEYVQQQNHEGNPIKQASEYAPSGHWLKKENIIAELTRLNPRNLTDWRAQSRSSHDAARKMKKHKEYFEEYKTNNFK